MDLHSNHSVHNGQAPVEWKLRDLCSGKLAVGVSEGDNRFVVLTRVRIGAHAVEASLSDRVFQGIGVVQMDCLGDYGARRDVGGIVREDERAELVLGTDFRINVGGIADCFLELDSKISCAARLK